MPLALCALLLCAFAPLHETLSSVLNSTTQSEQTVTLVAVGDIMLARGVGRKIERYGTAYPFALVEDTISRADIAFGNLECPITKNCERAAKRFSFRAEPRVVSALTEAGFDVLSLANNHSTDCGASGLLETMRNLEAAGIKSTGAGRTQAEAAKPTVIEIKGIKIAFVGFSEFIPEAASFDEEQASIAFASDENVRRSVAAARERADVVVASFHWGVEYASRPRERELKLARVAAEAGACLVIGHHTHVLQGMQTVTTKSSDGERRALVAYSLGNFVFDSPEGFDKRSTESVILRCTLSRRGLESFEATPVRLEGARPRPAKLLEAREISARLDCLSAELEAK
jgi:poly-gamma-glutamate synthesis protein (capsule biosynthesis protein)